MSKLEEGKGKMRHIRFIFPQISCVPKYYRWHGLSEKEAEKTIIHNHLLMIFSHLHNISQASVCEPTNGFIRGDLVY